MTLAFRSLRYPDASGPETPASCSPYSPFNTSSYARAAVSRQQVPYFFVPADNTAASESCLGLITGSRMFRRLEIPSTPAMSRPEEFWAKITDFCDTHGIAKLCVQSFASQVVRLPTFPNRISYQDRFEFVLDLDENLEGRLGKNHRRNIRKAAKKGIRLHRSMDNTACDVHLRLMQISMARRQSRGEDVGIPAGSTLHGSLVAAGAGEFFQARLGGDTVSSILILRAPAAAYYHSAGTSREGMSLGASQLVIYETAKVLAGEGLEMFNLGGAEKDAEGLRRFKSGFGCREIELSSASYLMIPRYQYAARSVFRNLVRAPGKMFSLVR